MVCRHRKKVGQPKRVNILPSKTWGAHGPLGYQQFPAVPSSSQQFPSIFFAPSPRHDPIPETPDLMHKPWQEADLGWAVTTVTTCDHIRQGSEAMFVGAKATIFHISLPLKMHHWKQHALETHQRNLSFGSSSGVGWQQRKQFAIPAQISKTIVHHGMGSYVSACSEKPWFYQARHGDERISRALKR